MTKAYAVLDDRGNILVHTVSKTVRAAKVNWLGTDGRMPMTDAWPDDMIADIFERERGKAVLVEVAIRVRDS